MHHGLSYNLVDGTTDSHLSPTLSQTGLILDNRAGGNLPAYSRDYDRFDFWGFDDVVFDFGDSSLVWDYLSTILYYRNGDGDTSEASYRLQFIG